MTGTELRHRAPFTQSENVVAVMTHTLQKSQVRRGGRAGRRRFFGRGPSATPRPPHHTVPLAHGATGRVRAVGPCGVCASQIHHTLVVFVSRVAKSVVRGSTIDVLVQPPALAQPPPAQSPPAQPPPAQPRLAQPPLALAC